MSQPKRQKRNISGWLVFDKPYDMTSTQAVGKVRWLFGAAKAGHAGTLDPLATGILPIALGEATKTVVNVQDGTKVYRFTVRWGAETTTGDAEGEIVHTSDARPDDDSITAALSAFVGKISQVPPTFSAIRVNGERAYDLARAGEDVVLAPRTVSIESFALVEAGPEAARFEVICQKGTYVRALARDLARALGTRGHVVALHRAAVGSFSDAGAITLAALEAVAPEARDAMLLPVAAGLRGCPELVVSPSEAAAIRHGNPILIVGANAPIALDEAWASCRGEAVATGSVAGGRFYPRRVLLPVHPVSSGA